MLGVSIKGRCFPLLLMGCSSTDSLDIRVTGSLQGGLAGVVVTLSVDSAVPAAVSGIRDSPFPRAVFSFHVSYGLSHFLALENFHREAHCSFYETIGVIQFFLR